MWSNPLPRNSLKTRFTLFTLALFVLGLWILSWFATLQLRKDMQWQMSLHQSAALNLLANGIHQGLTERLEALEKTAQHLTTELLTDHAALQAELKQHVVLAGLFNGDLLVHDQQGTAIAESNYVPGRLGGNYLDRDHINIALQHKQSAIGQVMTGSVSKQSGIGMSVPIRNAQGQAVGVLTGYLDLDKANFLNIISQQSYGATGGYLLIEPRQRRVITSTDSRRILEQLPAPGINPDIDDFLAGLKGTRIMRNPHGVEIMATVAALDTVGWVLAVTQPTDEAFAPIRAMQRRMLLATLLLTLLAGGLTWWMQHRQLAPIVETIQALDENARTGKTLAPLKVKQHDEIGQLIKSFNTLLDSLSREKNALAAQKTMLDRAEAVAHLGSWEWDLTTDQVIWSDELFHLFQLEPTDTSPPLAEQRKYFSASDLQRLEQTVNTVKNEHIPCSVEVKLLRPDGTSRDCLVRYHIALDANQQGVRLYGSFQDVTELKHAQLKQELAAKVFSNAFEGITITDTDGTILDVNNTFTHITGFSREEVVGQNPRLLKSGRQDPAFYETMWHHLVTAGHWSGEIWNRRKNGEVYPVLLNISAIRDAQGLTCQYVGLFSDITIRKAMEAQVQQLAFFDPLTALPNRRLLLDRVSQTLLTNKRSRRFGAIMFLDLDNFKPLNDSHGHALGDQLLVEVASRLRACVREMDTVARLGGDEFVVMLSELDAEAGTSAARAGAIAEKIRLSLAAPYVLAATPDAAGQPGHTVQHHCSSSIGVVLMAPDSSDIDRLLQQADAAMYQAKEQGRNRVVFGQ